MKKSEKSILFWVPGGMSLLLHVEGAIAKALMLRGIKVHAIICDGVYRACIKREITDKNSVINWSAACKGCKKECSSVLDKLEVPYSFIGDYVSNSSRDKLWKETEFVTWKTINNISYNNVNLSKNITSAIKRYLQGSELNGHEEIIREYAFSALIVAEAISAAINIFSPFRIFMSHGIYIDWGPALHTAFSLGIPVTAWMASYLRGHFYFRNVEDCLHLDLHNISDYSWNNCKKSILKPVHNEYLNKFLNDRYINLISFDMNNFMKYTGKTDFFRKKNNLLEKPVWGIFTHINWDGVDDYSPMAYASFNEWLLETIQEIIKIDNIQWLIKIHPAEPLYNPSSGMQSLIEKHFCTLPDHIKIIKADEEISPLDFYHLIDGAIAVYGTSGLELSVMGKPVILTGEAHYGNKGFTYDGLTPFAYKQLLWKVPTIKSLTEEQQLLAKKYAYCYFIQRQIPLQIVMDRNNNWWKFQENKKELLLPGKDPFMDFICEKISVGSDFIMDEELVQLAEKFQFVYQTDKRENN